VRELAGDLTSAARPCKAAASVFIKPDRLCTAYRPRGSRDSVIFAPIFNDFSLKIALKQL
jgi:hypothetical protein